MANRSYLCVFLSVLSFCGIVHAVEPLYLATEVRCDMMADDKGQLNGRLSEITLRRDAENLYIDAVLTASAGKSIVSRGSADDDMGIFPGITLN